ncbi:MAG TPA: hypothetical protein VFT53_07220 [Candidatus Saccharimonadales bacterium]|nr:hypothetical protein [Candidatus Saccharimonadales bacterium]
MKTQTDTSSQAFRAFPEFTKLTFQNRCQYEALIRNYPPVADISFPNLKVWWDYLDTCAVSRLHGNLVISYWFPGAEQYSGLSLVGTQNVDKSLCAIFDYLRDKGEEMRLVHVPEFVVAQIEYPELFVCKEERNFDEYILDMHALYPMNHLPTYRRHRLRKFLAQVDQKRIAVKSLDLSAAENRRLLLGKQWPAKGINKFTKIFEDANRLQVDQADILGYDNVCIFIDDELAAYCMYHRAADVRYAVFVQAKVDYAIPRVLDYAVYAFAQWFVERGISYVNLDYDLGVPFLRMIMITLGPCNYFRKYTLRPR